jgi:hypothetical protein
MSEITVYAYWGGIFFVYIFESREQFDDCHRKLVKIHNDKTLDPIQRKQELLSILQSPVLSRLLDLYNDIADRCDAQFRPEEIKK